MVFGIKVTNIEGKRIQLFFQVLIECFFLLFLHDTVNLINSQNVNICFFSVILSVISVNLSVILFTERHREKFHE